jgi:hypothetical protein
MTPEITKNTTVSTDPDKRPHILMNLDIVFPNTPCYLIDLDMKTSVSAMNSTSLISQLAWGHVDESGKTVEMSLNNGTIFPEKNINDAVNLPSKIKSWFESNYTC